MPQAILTDSTVKPDAVENAVRNNLPPPMQIKNLPIPEKTPVYWTDKHPDAGRGLALKVDRSGDACGECHRRGGQEEVNASGGFIKHHEQYEELFQGKHVTIDCVVCHDPHQGVIQLRNEGLQTTRTQCENCHKKETRTQNNETHVDLDVECIDCHMPRVTKSALGDPERYQGDIRTRLMGIDPCQDCQFNEDGSVALS